MQKFRRKKSFSQFFQQNFLEKEKSLVENSENIVQRFPTFQQTTFCTFNQKEHVLLDPFLNFSFDKNRLKNVVAWFLERYGQYKTIQFLEKLKEFGFGYATQGGLSLGIDDLKIPNQKVHLLAEAETKVSKDFLEYRNAKITGIERMQRLIYTWNQTNDMLKQEVVRYFETLDLFNPIYMMAFSGARGNMSQVRQLVGMRGLMSDPQGQIIDFPIQSNFREGLTLTEYLISTYGARKGIVDTALRTATAGYLTRRLVDVAQHVIVSQFDCGTSRGIFLFDMKEANKTIYSLQNRLVGRVLAQDILSLSLFENSKSVVEKDALPKTTDKNSLLEQKQSEARVIASRNQEIDSNLAFLISKITKKALVRSPLTCETPRLVCQLCYGWSLSQGKLVSVGEAVGVIAAQSIGEPGTQLTMRTFHTGGVFAGGLTDQILAPFEGKIHYLQTIPGSCIRTALSEIAFFTKMPGSFFLLRGGTREIQPFLAEQHLEEKTSHKIYERWKKENKNCTFSELYKIPAYAILFLRNHEKAKKKQVLAQFSTVAKKQFQYGTAEQTLFSTLAGELYLSPKSLPFENQNKSKKIHLLVEKKSADPGELSPLELKNDIVWKVQNWTNVWILSGKIFSTSLETNHFLWKGDSITKKTILNQVVWKKMKNWTISVQKDQSSTDRKKLVNMFYFLAFENQKNSKFSRVSSFFQSLPLRTFQKNCQAFEVEISPSKRSRILSQSQPFVSRFLPQSSLLFHLSKKKTQNLKVFKGKEQILFSGNFSRLFRVPASFVKEKQKNKRPLQEIHFQFSTREKKAAFFNFAKYIKIWNTSQKFRNTQPESFLFFFQKKHAFFSRGAFHKFAQRIWSSQKKKSGGKVGQTLPKHQGSSSQQSSFFHKNRFQSQAFFFKKSAHHAFQNQDFFSIKDLKQTSKLDGSFFKSYFEKTILEKNRAHQKLPAVSPSQLDSRQICFQKTLFSLHYEKVRYKNFAYSFFFSNSSQTPFQKYSFRSFRAFQHDFDIQNPVRNSGKLFSTFAGENGNFFGKDLSPFFTYCFPQDYQTQTNGLFTVFSFENFSRKKKITQFLTLHEEKLGGQFFSIFQKRQKLHREKRKTSFRTPENLRIIQKLFPFQSMTETIVMQKPNLFSLKKKNFFFGSVKNFSVFQKERKHQSNFSPFSFSQTQNFERYTEEIFWLPQENYAVSFVDFQKIQQNDDMFSTQMIFQFEPVFSFSNRQGTKKSVFSSFEGICQWSIGERRQSYRSCFKKKAQKFSSKVFFSFGKKQSFVQQKFSVFPRKKKNVQIDNSQLFKIENIENFKKSSLSFFNFEFFFQTSSSNLHLKKFQKKVHKDNFFKKQNGDFLSSASSESRLFGNFQKDFQKVFSRNFQKKYAQKTFLHQNTLFSELFENSERGQLFKSQKIATHFQSHCFTCFPFQKFSVFKTKNTFEKTKTRPQGKDNTFFLQSTNFQHPSEKRKFPLFSFSQKKLHVQIESGWLCVFPNSIFVVDWHQLEQRQGHFFGGDFCFEQQKVLVKTVLFQENSFAKIFTRSLKEKFCSQTFQKNRNCRFSTGDSGYALQRFSLKFGSFERGSFSMDKKKSKKEKSLIALFFRPFHYKLLENPKNYKAHFQQKTIDHSGENSQSISFCSSLTIYKKYHSNILNLQKQDNTFFHHSKKFDSTIHSTFHHIHRRKDIPFSAFLAKKLTFGKANFSKFKKNRGKFDFSPSKKVISQEFFQSSKKQILLKFHFFLSRPLFQNRRLERNQRKTRPALTKNRSFQFSSRGPRMPQKNAYFFSFYPLQFLPLLVSNAFNDFDQKESQVFSTFSVDPFRTTLNFSLAQKKALFLTQRFSSVFFSNKETQTSFFWLNKDGRSFFSKNWIQKKNSKRFLTFSSFVEKNQPLGQPKNQISLEQTTKKSKTLLFKNFLFQKNSSFFANTKFFSPFEGELISMYTNETNWWKHASEISTIQKLTTFFSVVTKEDLFSLEFVNEKRYKEKYKNFEYFSFQEKTEIETKGLSSPTSQQNPISRSFNGQQKTKFLQHQRKYSLQEKQQNLGSLSRYVLQTHKTFSFGPPSEKHSIAKYTLFPHSQENTDPQEGFTENQIFERTFEVSSFLTKYENKIFKFQNLNIGYSDLSKTPRLGKFFVYGDCLFNFAVRKPGMLIHLSSFQITFRRGQPFLVSPNGILHLANTPYIQKNVPILTLPYQTVQSGDIVQGIPKVEQFFEARTTIQGRLFLSSLPILLKGIFERYKYILPLDQAVRQSFLKIQQLIVDGVQRVYRSQGVSIVDKHLEVIVRQMTTKVQILHGAQTGFFPGELVNLELVERINKFLLVKIRYEPVILGITRASLEVESFLSASSFQQTTKILALASISRKKDFLKGLKENILVGNLMPSGTGYMVLTKNVQ